MSQKVPLRHALNTQVCEHWVGMAWIASLAWKIEVDPVLKSFIPVGRLNTCYAATPTLHGPFVPPWLLIKDSDSFCVFKGTEDVRRCCQGFKIHVGLYGWLSPLAMVGPTY